MTTEEEKMNKGPALAQTTRDRPGRDRLVEEAGKPPFQLGQAAGQQHVQLTALRSSRPRFGPGAEDVPVDDDHLAGLVTEHPRGQHPGDAPAQHDRPPEDRFGRQRRALPTQPREHPGRRAHPIPPVSHRPRSGAVAS